MQTLFRSLLYLYPAAFSREFGSEMMWVFSQSWRDACRQGFWPRALFLSREIVGVLLGASRERFSGWDSTTRRLPMRPFRFPRSVILLMLMILFNVFVVIETLREATSTGAYKESTLLPLPMIGIFLFLALVLGAIGYTVLRILNRSAVQRLSKVEPWVRAK